MKIPVMIYIICTLFFISCSKVIIKNFDQLKITALAINNEIIILKNELPAPVLKKIESEDGKPLLKIEFDLKDTQTFNFIESIINNDIDGYIVIKNADGHNISYQKINFYCDSVHRKSESQIMNESDFIKVNQIEQSQHCLDKTELPAQFIFVNESLVFRDSIYTIYFQGKVWNENKTIFRNISTVPKFISIETLGDIIFEEFENIEFFVTGYYRPTTKEQLEKLIIKINNGKVNLPISNITPNDSRNIQYVETAFDSLYLKSKNIFKILNQPFRKDHLQLEFIGSTDPRNISAKYLEESVIFKNNDPEYPDINIAHGTVMNNFILSKLRAYYTMIYVDELFLKDSNFKALKKQGRIHYKLLGKGPDKTKKEMEKARKVDIRISRISPPKLDK